MVMKSEQGDGEVMRVFVVPPPPLFIVRLRGTFPESCEWNVFVDGIERICFR